MRAFYDSHIERNGKEGLPTSHKVRLRSLDSSGHEYNETAVIGIDAMKGTMFAEVKTVHHVATSLAEIEKVLKSAAVMGRRGSLQVDASIESRAVRKRRTARRKRLAEVVSITHQLKFRSGCGEPPLAQGCQPRRDRCNLCRRQLRDFDEFSAEGFNVGATYCAEAVWVDRGGDRVASWRPIC